jgi:hypothetical protein
MFRARLADESAHVNQARRNNIALTIDDARLSRELVPRDRSAYADDDALDDDQPATRLGLLNGIDKARVDEGDRRR